MRAPPLPVRVRLAIAATMLLAGCGQRDVEGPIDVSVIGPTIDPARLPSPDRGTIDAPAEVLEGATRQGLLRFDAAGQIVPGMAARWIVSESGRSLIFRLPDDPAVPPISAEAIARRLRAAIAPASRNELKPLLGAVTEIDAVTPQVVDIELSAPRPNLLQLFAQPGLGIGGAKDSGPFAVTGRTGGWLTLRERVDPETTDSDRAASAVIVRMRGERSGTAVARFVGGGARLVLGGRFNDLPIARAAALPRGTLRFDPVNGLFGLAFAAASSGLTADPINRRAMAMAIDRDRIGRLLDVPGWGVATAIVALGTSEIARPVAPDWTERPIADRQAEAAKSVSAWYDHNAAPRALLRVALPPGPGARLLFAAIAADWRMIGIDTVAVSQDAAADLRLVDEVAPGDTAAFYLRRFACERGVPCSEATDQILRAARAAPSLAEREALFAQADVQLAATAPFIALGSPIRWSLVAPDLNLYRDSPRALHPLNELSSAFKR